MEPAGPFDVAVSLLEFNGDPVPTVTVLVSDPEGAQLKVTDTQVTGVVTVSVPKHGRVSVFFQDGSVRRVYSAEVVFGVDKLDFHWPVSPPDNTPANPTLSAGCAGACASFYELSLSCQWPFVITDTVTPVATTLSGYQGCPQSTKYDAFMVGYDSTTQLPVERSSATDASITGLNLGMPVMVPVAAADRSSISMEIVGPIDGYPVSRRVEVPYATRPGFGFSRMSSSDVPLIELPLVTVFVPRVRATSSIKLSNVLSLVRQDHLDPFQDGTALSFDLGSLAVPEVPPLLDLANPSQPVAAFALAQGPVGDAVQFEVASTMGTQWMFVGPAATSGEIVFPALPEGLDAYRVTAVDYLRMSQVDVDGAADYPAFIAEGITNRVTEPSPSSATVATSER